MSLIFKFRLKNWPIQTLHLLLRQHLTILRRLKGFLIVLLGQQSARCCQSVCDFQLETVIQEDSSHTVQWSGVGTTVLVNTVFVGA
jgi:hypothetical protein